MEIEIEDEGLVESHEEWSLRRKRERMIVTRFQGMAALLQAGLLPAIEQHIENLDDPIAVLAWKEARFHRLSPLVISIGSQLGLSDEQLDELFVAAAEIVG